MIKKRSKSDPKTILKRYKNDPKKIQKRSKNDPKMTNKRSKNDPKMIQIDPKTIQKLWLWINPTCLRDDIFSLVYAEPETWDGSAPKDSVQTNPDTSSLNTWQPLHAYIKKYIDQELPYSML